MTQQLTLILGGARSGKSTYALRMAAAPGAEVLFLATAEARDDEMAAKIERHRAERPTQWHTVEATHAPAAALANAPATPVVLLDCVTLWVSNLVLADGASWAAAAAELEALLAWHRQSTSDLIVVSNEVGLGLVPVDPLSRTYREWLGWFNQRLATAADRVFLLVAGLAVNVKALAEHTRND